MKSELCKVVCCQGKAEGTRGNLSLKTYSRTHGNLSLKTYGTPCGNVGSAEAELTDGGTACGRLCCRWSLTFSSFAFAARSLHKQVER